MDQKRLQPIYEGLMAHLDGLHRALILEGEARRKILERYMREQYDKEIQEPRLGLATTRDLLEEVATRSEIIFEDHTLAQAMRHVLQHGNEEHLNYRTVDGA